jgi:hypothetical protein
MDTNSHTLEATAEQVASGFIHHLAPAFRTPARLVCPSDEAEQAIVKAVIRAAAAQKIPDEVINLRPAPAERLDAVTARLDGWRSGSVVHKPDTMPTLLILLGFDVFGDDKRQAPTYPFRSRFQFDRKFLWLLVGRDVSRMRFLFGSSRRPLYQAASDITPEDWKLASPSQFHPTPE